MRQIVAIICPAHGFTQGSSCPQCTETRPKDTLHINTYDWVKQGVYEHIDPSQPNMGFNSKEDLKVACEKRGLLAKAFIKPKSQGKGFEHSRR